MEGRTFAALAKSEPLGQAMLPCRVHRLRCKSDRGLRLMLRYKGMCSYTQRPGKAVGIFPSTRVCDRRLDAARPSFGITHEHSGLRCIDAADHARMFAIDREFVIRKSVRERYSLIEEFDSLL